MKIITLSVSLSLLFFNHAQSADDDKGGQSIAEFEKSDKLDWKVVNDGVMGGLSKGNVVVTKDGTMRFSGNLSLKNNGGFSTVRTGNAKYDLSNAEGLLMKVKGDGRTYQARLGSDARFRGMEISFGADFKTKKGEWLEVKVPFTDFKGSFRGMSLKKEKLNPAKIQQFGILLGDKKEGPFEIEVEFIRTYSGAGDSDTTTTATGSGNLSEIAVKDGRFKTLVAALGSAGLVEAISSDKKLTVFAPTDEAFAKLPKGVVEDLLKPENKQKLISILTYHVVAGSVELGDALKLGKGNSLQGSELKFSFANGAVRINDAALIDSDIKCSNGIIHVIDSVLLPPEPARKTILSTAKDVGQFSTLLAAIGAAGLEKALEGKGPLTVLAPTDKAFAALPKGTVETLLKKENRDQLVSILTYHVIPGKVGAGAALTAGTAKTLNGSKVNFAVKDGLLKVNGATIRTIDVDGGNGVIHVIDSVLIPDEKPSGDSKTTAADKMQNQDPMDIIVASIKKGVPAYNSGDAALCADIYRDCIAILAKNPKVDPKLREMLAGAGERGTKYKSDRERAWYYRKVIDRVVGVHGLQ